MLVTNSLKRGFRSVMRGMEATTSGVPHSTQTIPVHRLFNSTVLWRSQTASSKHVNRLYCTVPTASDAVPDDKASVEDTIVNVTGATEATPSKYDLEIKDSKVIFTTVWNKLEAKKGRNTLKFPKEIIWLGGAPGSGKGTNTPFIQRVRGITNPPIVMSELLDQDATTRAIKDSGGLVTDSIVLELLLNKLLQKEYQNGVIVDGFPRTNIQVEFTKMLHDKMKELRKDFLHADDGFRRPTFRVAVLYVEEKESVERQLRRGREAIYHNEQVMSTGHGQLWEVRATDRTDEAARARYRIFKEHFSTLQTLREYFPFSLINASGTVADVENSILREFSYQSSLELASETFDSIQHIPLVTDVTKHARQDLVQRLDYYQLRQTELFGKVVSIIQKEFVPVIKRHAIAGISVIRTDNDLFSDPTAIDMAIDILSERGFHVLCDIKTWDIPDYVDPLTHKIICKTGQLYMFQVRFQRPNIRHPDSQLIMT